jgi:hypothetical protein
MSKAERDLAREAALRAMFTRAGYSDPKCSRCCEHRIVRLAIPWKRGEPPRKHRVLCRNCLADKKHDPALDVEMLSRFRKAGFPNPKCTLCPESRIWCLELDHIAGQKHDDTCWPLCCNCHAERSFFQRVEPEGDGDPKNPLRIIGEWLKGIAQWLELIIDKLYEFGDFLINLAKQGYGGDLSFP